MNPPADYSELAAAVHASGCRIVVACTGGGSGAIAALVQTPGASRTMLEGRVPYSSAALVEWLGATPEHFCSEATARAMAMAAWQRARTLDPESPVESLLGIACTASLASDRPKRGEHRIHVAAQSANCTWAWSLTMSKWARSRAAEEEVATALVLDGVVEAANGVGGEPPTPVAPAMLSAGESIERASVAAPEPWEHLLSGRAKAAQRSPGEGWREISGAEPARRRIVFPGAFNPLHEGHRQMAALAAARLGAPVDFELSIANVDKAPLDFIEIERRAEQFAESTVVLTAAPTFVEKARLFRGATFVVGVDTIARIAEPRYYGSASQRDAALAELKSLGTRFLVFGRAKEGRLATLAEMQLPGDLAELCEEVPASEFRKDVSSTELRKGW